MHSQFQNPVRIVLAFLFLVGLSAASAIDFSWEGKTYRDVKVIDVTADGLVILESRKEERIKVPRKLITGFLIRDVEKAERDQKIMRPNRLDRRGRLLPPDQNTFERAWIYGSASDVTESGFLVDSSESALPVRKPGKNGEYREPKKIKSGAPIYNGVVFVRGLRTNENSLFDRVLWRDGYVKQGLKRLPAFASAKPTVEVPIVAEQRVWTDGENRKMTATLKKVKDGKGQFVAPSGKVFVYELAKLGTDDQVFLSGAVAEYEKAIAQLRKDYPWLDLD